MFIETASKRGDRINTTEIVRLWKDKDGVTVAELRDGKRERLGFGNPVNIVALAACELLPAQPGFEHLVAYFGGDEDVSFSRQPIIGWRVDAIRPRPVVVDDWFEGANDYKREFLGGAATTGRCRGLAVRARPGSEGIPRREGACA